MNNSAARAGSISTSRPSIFLLQPPHGLRQQAGQARGPFGLTCFPGDQVLANFDFDMDEPAALAAHGDSVVGRVAHPIRRIVPHNQVAPRAQQRK